MVAYGNKKMKVRKPNDYKSIALPAELQGLGVFFRLFSLVYQVIQQELNFYSVRCCYSSQLFAATCSWL